MRAGLIALTLVTGFATPVLGCPTPQSYSYSVLPALPEFSERERVVARVEIIALEPPSLRNASSRSARVRVVEAIRGVEAGRELVVLSLDRSPCVQWFYPADVGSRGYIAGVIDPASGAFHGGWRGGVRVD